MLPHPRTHPRRHLRLPLPILLLAALPATAGTVAGQVQGLVARHRFGQTFLTWDELSAPNVTYRVYRARSPLLHPQDLDDADLLGVVDDKTSDNRGRSFATGQNHNWIVEPGGAQLPEDTGLFVHTVRERFAYRLQDFLQPPYPAYHRTWYAVTSVQGGNEDRTLVAGENVRTVYFEFANRPEPVLQNTDATGELWAHWVGDRDTPFQPALHLLPSQGFNFRYDRGAAPGPRGVVVRLHAAGQHYGNAWPHRNEVPPDVDVLAPHDAYQGPGWTLWLGLHESFPGSSAGASEVRLFTIQRVRWTLDWLAARLGDEHDPERVYAVGGSMGGMGSFYLASEYPDRFAAILCRNGNFDLRAPDINNAAFVQDILGTYGENLPVGPGLPTEGLGVFDRTDAGALAQLFPAGEGPVYRTINGRNDTTVGWRSAVTLFDALASTHRPGVHYFDVRRHNPFGHWSGIEQKLLNRTFATRRDRPSLTFSGLTIDDDPGNGDPSDGDPIGTVNGYVDYDPATAVSGSDFCAFEVYLRDEGALDDAPTGSAQVALTPRRTGPFTLAPGDEVLFTLVEGMSVVATHGLTADGNGLVHTPPVPVTRARRLALFDRVSGASQGGGGLSDVGPAAPGGAGTRSAR